MSRALTIARLVWMEILRRKELYVLLILLGALLVTLVSLDVFGLGGAAGYVKDIGLLAAWVFSWILAVHVGARQLPQEESSGTIFPLLAKPIGRMELLAGKWMGAWTAVSAATLLFYALVAGVVALKGGRFEPVVIAQGFLLHAVGIGLMAALALLFSTRMHRDAASSLTYVCTAAAFIVLPRVPELLVRETGIRATVLMALYYLVPHLELFDMRKRMTHAYGPMNWHVFCLIVLYGCLFVGFFLLLAWLAYRHKRFVRGSLG